MTKSDDATLLAKLKALRATEPYLGILRVLALLRQENGWSKLKEQLKACMEANNLMVVPTSNLLYPRLRTPRSIRLLIVMPGEGEDPMEVCLVPTDLDKNTIQFEPSKTSLPTPLRSLSVGRPRRQVFCAMAG